MFCAPSIHVLPLLWLFAAPAFLLVGNDAVVAVCEGKFWPGSGWCVCFTQRRAMVLHAMQETREVCAVGRKSLRARACV